jgi:endoglucanase
MKPFKNLLFPGSLFAAITFLAQTSALDFVPENPPEMKRLTNANSPAHQAARLFLRGVNLGNYLEVPPTQTWNVTVSADEFPIMRREGFDHIRVPAGWHHYTGPGPDFMVAPEFFARVDFVVTNALGNGLAVIVNIHHFDAFTSDPSGETDKFLAIWRQVAEHYQSFPNRLAFELLNEPKDAATTNVMNPIHAKAIAEIRKTNPQRAIFVGPGQWNQVSELKRLVLPEKDDNLIVAVHCYDPFYFTHQGASWAGPDPRHLRGIQFPGPPSEPLKVEAWDQLRPPVRNWIERYNTLPEEQNPSSPSAFEEKLKLARAWSDYYGRPVHVGEFGCYTTADPESRARFHSEFRRALDEQQLGWALWDWSAGFRYWDRKKNQPMPGLREALMEKRD